MSWDLLAFACNEPPPRMAELPSDWRPDALLGAASEVRARIDALFPSTDWTDPTFGLFEDANHAFEFGVGDEDPVVCLGVHVRGGGRAAVDALLALSAANAWYLIDTTQNEWMHHVEDVEAGWKRFQAARDAIAKRIGS